MNTVITASGHKVEISTGTATETAAHDGFGFSALHAAPEGPRKGGVIVIQEIFGLDPYVQADVARWAARGYEVVAPSMFDRQGGGFTAGHDDAGVQAGVAAGVPILRMARADPGQPRVLVVHLFKPLLGPAVGVDARAHRLHVRHARL